MGGDGPTDGVDNHDVDENLNTGDLEVGNDSLVLSPLSVEGDIVAKGLIESNDSIVAEREDLADDVAKLVATHGEDEVKDFISLLATSGNVEKRGNMGLLSGLEESDFEKDMVKNSIKTEQSMRIAAYTEGMDDKGFYIVNLRTEQDEWDVGLGEIFVDTAVQYVELITNEGIRLIGRRGRNHDGRIAFMVVLNGQITDDYLEVFSGYRVRPVYSTDEIAEDVYMKEIEVRKEYVGKYEKEEAYNQSSFNERYMSVKKSNYGSFDSKTNVENFEEVELGRAELEQMVIPPGKMKPKAFGEAFLPFALYVRKKWNVPIAICLAQCALETGWNGSSLAKRDRNFFGIKASKKYPKSGNGTGKYRSYNSVGGSPVWSFDDYGLFLNENSRYRKLQHEKTNEVTGGKGIPWEDHSDYVGWAYGLQNAGYPGDSLTYAPKVISIIKSAEFYKYDIWYDQGKISDQGIV